jgi:hypothetical protein
MSGSATLLLVQLESLVRHAQHALLSAQTRHATLNREMLVVGSAGRRPDGRRRMRDADSRYSGTARTLSALNHDFRRRRSHACRGV